MYEQRAYFWLKTGSFILLALVLGVVTGALSQSLSAREYFSITHFLRTGLGLTFLTCMSLYILSRYWPQHRLVLAMQRRFKGFVVKTFLATSTLSYLGAIPIYVFRYLLP